MFVVVVIFSRVSEISDTSCFLCVCNFVATQRVDPEECAMVFQHIFGPWHQHPQVCFISSVGVDLCKHGQMLIQ